MAKTIRFSLEHKDVLWSGKNKKGADSELLELKAHELVTKKFINAYAWEVMASPLRLDTKYEATWGKPMEHDNEKKFTLWNFEPILDTDATADTPAEPPPKEKISEPAGSRIKPPIPPMDEIESRGTSTPKKASEYVGTAMPDQGDIEYREHRPTYEEAKADLLKSLGQFLDMLYVDKHLGVK